MDKIGDSEVLDCNVNVIKLSIVKLLMLKLKARGEMNVG